MATLLPGAGVLAATCCGFGVVTAAVCVTLLSIIDCVIPAGAEVDDAVVTGAVVVGWVEATCVEPGASTTADLNNATTS